MESDARILLADASTAAPTTRELLRGEGFAVEHALDRAAALALLAASRAQVAIVDVGLPGDGWQLLEAIRADASQRLTPVVMLAAAPEQWGRALALARGADDLLGNPPPPTELVARVRRCAQARHELLAAVERTRQLWREPPTDSLEPLLEQPSFLERLHDEFRRAQRYGAPLSLLLLDLDQFHRVNERFGRSMGDEALQQVVNALRGALRQTDLLCRYGGEEFAALLPQTHLTGALTVAERIGRQLAAVRAGPGGVVRVTASLGVAGFPAQAIATAEHLLRAADAALAQARAVGGKIVLHRPGLGVGPA